MKLFRFFEIIGALFRLAFDREYIEQVAYETRTSEEEYINWLKKTGRLK